MDNCHCVTAGSLQISSHFCHPHQVPVNFSGSVYSAARIPWNLPAPAFMQNSAVYQSHLRLSNYKYCRAVLHLTCDISTGIIPSAQRLRSNNHITCSFSSACYKCVELTAVKCKFLTVGVV